MGAAAGAAAGVLDDASPKFEPPKSSILLDANTPQSIALNENNTEAFPSNFNLEPPQGTTQLQPIPPPFQYQKFFESLQGRPLDYNAAFLERFKTGNTSILPDKIDISSFAQNQNFFESVGQQIFAPEALTFTNQESLANALNQKQKTQNSCKIGGINGMATSFEQAMDHSNYLQ